MELRSAIAKVAEAARTGQSPRPAVTLDRNPGCIFGAVVEQRLKDIECELAEVKGRLNGLIFLVAGAVVVDVVMRLAK